MNYTREITLDLNPENEIPVVRVKQGDASTRFVKATLEKDGEQYIPEEGVRVLFRCQKPDGTSVMTDSSAADTELGRYLVVINQDGTITVELVEQVMTVPGRCRCDLCLFINEEVLSTLPFAIMVIPSPNTTILAVSTNDFRTLSSRITAAENLMRGVAQSIATLTIGTDWIGDESPYHQMVTVTGYTVTANTKVDIMADPSVIQVMLESECSEILIINDSGRLTVYAMGGQPTVPLVVQVCLYETLAV